MISSSPGNSAVRSNDQPLQLVLELLDALKKEEINYCHWKSNNALDRSANGQNDLDLLIDRADANRFQEILFGLGFKQAIAPPEADMNGVLNYYGYDEVGDIIFHVHAHYLLIMGHDATKNFHLPMEKAYLESAEQTDFFRVPAVEFEYVVFIIRMILKHSTWDAIFVGDGSLKKSEKRELEYLQERIRPERVKEILCDHLPYIDPGLFEACVQALKPGCPMGKRIQAGQRMQGRLRAYARLPLTVDPWVKLWRKFSLAVRRRLFKYTSRSRLQAGGAEIAIIGGDGSGKSTAIEAADTWLGHDFAVRRVHMGKPAWSWFTILVRGILKAGQFMGLYPLETSFRETLEQKSLVSPGYPYLIREVCRARDRFLTYLDARAYVEAGGIVIYDRFPLPQIQTMDGPQARRFIEQLMVHPRGSRFFCPRPSSSLAQWLVKREEQYYRQMPPPNLRFVFQLDPEEAVRRKPGDDSVYVHERNKEIRSIHWEGAGAILIDAGKPKNEVAAELKRRIWSEL